MKYNFGNTFSWNKTKHYRYDGCGLFEPARLKALTKVNTDSARDFLFADDCVLNTISEEDLQANMVLFSKACKNSQSAS